jgi:two-component system, OmpR family, copper resistance phosphate regulon response regulator CusR
LKVFPSFKFLHFRDQLKIRSKGLRMKILFVEDEVKVAKLVQTVLKEAGYQSDVAYDGLMGKKLAISNKYDLIILDLILPEINGIDLCKTIRKAGITAPVLMLTALDNTEDIVDGLDSGANDYLTKPFKIEELLARIRALGRLKQIFVEERIYEIEDLTLNTATKEVHRNGQLIKLTAKEFALLELLLRNKNRVISKSYISENIWGNDYDLESNFVEVYINFLRNKIDKNFSPKLIHTIVGMGYVIKVAA